MNAAVGLMEVRVPDLGNFKDVAVIDVLVKPGDTVAVDTPLVTLESDKAAMDVPSTVGGVIEKLHTAKGGKVSTGDLIATVKTDGAPGAATPEAQGAPAPAAPPAKAAPASNTAPAPAAAPPATPAPAAPVAPAPVAGGVVAS
jgi:pyruvate dehydrogenase E2 component (dihydrolipoamide acetyltransferase)